MQPTEDEELEMAIALSLLESSPRTFPGPQLSYFLNYLPNFSRANKCTIQISDIIQPTAISCILTTYLFDLAWLLKTCPVLSKIPVMLYHCDKGAAEYEAFLPLNFHTSVPSLPIPYGVCHGKIMIVKYPSFLRVAVSTANLLSFDYARKTQGIWVQDLPLKKDSTLKSTILGDDFKNTLADYLSRLGLDDIKFLDNYCYAEIKIVLLTSVPGYHTKAALDSYGHMKVRKFMEQHKADPKFRNASLISQVSSIGSLSIPWINELRTSFLQFDDNKKNAPIPEMNVVWPTVDFVRNCIDGYSAGGSLCFPKSNLKPFLNDIFCEYKPTPGRAIIPPHIKTYTLALQNQNPNKKAKIEHQKEEVISPPKKTKIDLIVIDDDDDDQFLKEIPRPTKKRARQEEENEEQDDNNQLLAWVILTSSNLSKAAWGSLQKTNTQLMIRHYEAGILFLPQIGQKTLKVFGSEEEKGVVQVPLPSVLPLTKYGAKTEAWVWDVPRKEKDILGKTVD